ncbi:AAA family ATPase [Deinococcus sp. KNUC1210]|uniref:AAA family ATPase n=1 Tax=Deinococcus sp. KNUC1210 TaxID=2917691 RepID=UPI001EEFBE5A|nr:AAA family ATPase [Deinococcus sp. KNUC1210]ULH15835.1 AAA family ATPase [Deinococcus sp. KNUC1210]
MTAPTLFIMVGLPGAGKTTLAKQLEQQHAALRLTPDDWMMPLFGWGQFENKREVVEALLWTIAARTLSLGVNVVLDYGLWGRSERDDYRARAAAVGARVQLHYLDAPFDELWRRIEARNQALRAGEVPISRTQLEEYWSIFDPQRPTAEELESAEPLP